MPRFRPTELTARETPIPDQQPFIARRKGFRAHPIDQTSPMFREELIDLGSLGIKGVNFYHRADNPPYYMTIPGAIPDLLLRTSVAQALGRVNTFLNEYGLELFVHDAFRPLAVQRYFYNEWMPAQLRKKRPQLSGEALTQEVEKYWAKPPVSAAETSISPSPHFTGAAVDLTLRHINGDLLEMGGLFDDPSERSHRDFLEHKSGQDLTDQAACENRRILHWSMAREGFIGHPLEWWHFSIGDQLWAKLSGAPMAYYGPAAEFG